MTKYKTDKHLTLTTYTSHGPFELRGQGKKYK